MRYRIISNGEKFRIERQCWLRWQPLRQVFRPGGGGKYTFSERCVIHSLQTAFPWHRIAEFSSRAEAVRVVGQLFDEWADVQPSPWRVA